MKWLPHMDKIIVMKDGSVAEIGTYDQLMEHDGAFAIFLKAYLTEHTSDSDSDEEGISDGNNINIIIKNNLTGMLH